MNTSCESCTCSGDQIDRLLNQDEVAEMLSVSVRTLEYWRSKGGGPGFVKVGKLARYRTSVVRTYIEKLGGNA